MALLEVEGITVEFAGLTALKDVSFTLEPGQIRAVIGPNGAGKSTLFNAITGYVTPVAGRVRFKGTDVQGQMPHRTASLGMRRTFQNGGVFAEMTVLENVLAGLSARTRSGMAGILFRLPGAHRAERQATEEAYGMLDMMGLADLAHQVAGDLSSGQQRLVEITRALAARTDLLLLDEPAVGLTSSDRDRLTEVLRKLASGGIAVLLVEHVMDLVMAVSDRIVVMNYGEVIAEGLPEEIRSHEAVLEAYLGHE